MMTSLGLASSTFRCVRREFLIARIAIRHEGLVLFASPLSGRALFGGLLMVVLGDIAEFLADGSSIVSHGRPPFAERAPTIRKLHAYFELSVRIYDIVKADKDDFKYWAFISYSHQDKRWGDWLHKALETYPVPKGLVGKPSRDGVVPARVFPIFRDREELPVSADLDANIQEALRQSRYLIVICSPRSAASLWVNEEILTFKRLGGANRLLAVIVDGEPNASDGKPGVSVGEECFPPALRFQLGADGGLSSVRTEPIAADAREGRDGKTYAKLKLLAGLLGVNFDDLKQRENERRMQRLRRVATGAAALLALFVALSVYAFRQAELAREKLSAAYSLRALQAADAGDDASAALLYAESYAAHRSPSNGARGASTLAGIARLRARFAAGDCARIAHDRNLSQAGVCPQQFVMTPDAKLLIGVPPLGPVKVFDVAKDELVGTLPTTGNQPSTALALSPDGKTFATGDFGGLAHLWRVDTLQPIGKEIRHAPAIHALAFSRDGESLYTWTDAGERRWDVATGQAVGPEHSLSRDLYVQPTSSPDGSHTLLIRDEAAQLWDLAGNVPGPVLTHARPVNAAVWSPNGLLVATASPGDGTAIIWDARTAQKLATLSHGQIMSVAFSPDGGLLATAGRDDAARLWEVRRGRPTGAPMKQVDVESLAFSPDGKYLATGSASADTTVRIWSVPAGRLSGHALQHDQPVGWLAWPTPSTLLTAEIGGEIRIWDATMRSETSLVLDHGGEVKGAAFSPDGARIVTQEGSLVRLWDATSGARIGGDITADFYPTFSPDSTRLAITRGNDIVEVWDALTATRIAMPMKASGRRGAPRSIFSRDSRRLATFSGSTAQVWDSTTGDPIGRPLEHSDDVIDVAFSMDGSEVITASWDNLARRWNATTGESLGVGWPRADLRGTGGTLSPDGRWLVTGQFGAVGASPLRIWHTETGKQIGSDLRYDPVAQGAMFSPDSRRFVTVDDRNVRIWNTASAEQVGITIPVHGAVNAVNFSRDSRWLATADSDGTARIWDLETGEPAIHPLSHDGAVLAVSFSRDGRRLLTGSADRRARVFDVSYLVDQPVPARLLLQVEVATGLRLNARGEIERIPLADWETLRDRLR